MRAGPQLTAAGDCVKVIPCGGEGVGEDILASGVCLSGGMIFCAVPVFATVLVWRRGRAKEKNQIVLASITTSVNAMSAVSINPRLLITRFARDTGEI